MSASSHNFAVGGIGRGGNGEVGPSEQIREEFSEAFSFTEGEEESPTAEGLRAVVPAPPPLDFAEFQEESSNHRVLILRRGAVIAVTTLVSIGGALFLHSLFASVFVLGMFFGRAPARPVNSAGSGGDAISEGGSGFMVIDSPPPAASPTSGAQQSAAALLETSALAPSNLLPALPQSLPETATVQRPIEPVQPPPAPLTMQMPEDLGTVRVTPPARVTEATVAPQALAVAPPGPAVVQAAPPTPAPASPSGRAGGTGARAADIGDGDYSDEPIFSLLKGDGSGEGRGTGRGRGTGLDRGMSAAYSKAQLLSPLNFRVPFQYQVKRPAKDILLNVTVLATGLPGDVTVTQSCGIPELDTAFRDYVAANVKFRPAFERGKAVSSVEQIGQMFGNE